MQFLRLATFLVLVFGFIANTCANIIYQSANLGTAGDIALGMDSDQFIGTRFHLDEAHEITSFGGHLFTLGNFNYGSAWGAIIALPDPISLPDFHPSEIESYAITFGLFDTKGQFQDIRTLTNIVLEAGHYALIFGGSTPGSAGLFGATNNGGLAISGTGFSGFYDSGQHSTTGASFFTAYSDFINGNWQLQGWQEDDGSIFESAPRFVLEGNIVPVNGPASISILIFSVLGIFFSRRNTAHTR